MPKYISILRGINVGGKRKILMKELKDLYKELGFTNVVSYIQSGNLIFNANEATISSIEQRVSKAILERFGYNVPVLVLSNLEWKRMVSENPFSSHDINKLHVTLLKDLPTEYDVEVFKSKDFAPDLYHLNGQYIYIKCDGKYHQSKLSNTAIERHLKVEATSRNWKTVIKISELLNE
ncbi:DUF1697 domain-containing protein [Carboxylicivirga mesophila]|uniref:DUF1697 domain-containing protein n=1 Tax=Carboxylicivirga mesophila TaxID=1166478 RepID=A0ABS5K789_9BACT|nr:DUF1697 domain-containing protein [Carboxylicivirga mesophila]MBS2210376.1 DUF1697 domain-containing protein [Carboxylicivirga mesophila]